jgi:RHS repeat-associated protein
VATQPYRYSTKEIHHASGMYDYGFRFYSPGLGRWINRDPIREQGGANMYAFSGNTPLNAMDANGLFIDAALDVGSIGYDIYRLIQDPCSTENWVALGMDLAGLAIPFATGLGPASRIANHADEVLAGVTHADEAAAYYRISEREIVKPEVAQDAAQLFAERFAESGKTLASS